MKRTHKQIRKDILNILNDGKQHSYGNLERKVNTNWNTIRDHCSDLSLFGMIEIIENKVSITNAGREFLKRL